MHSAETCGRNNILPQNIFKTMLVLGFKKVSGQMCCTHWQVSGEYAQLKLQVQKNVQKWISTHKSYQYSNAISSANQSRIDSLSLLSESLWFCHSSRKVWSSFTLEMVTFRACADQLFRNLTNVSKQLETFLRIISRFGTK